MRFAPRDTETSVEDPSALLQVLARDTRGVPKIPMASAPSLIAQELAEIKDLKLLKEECGWDEDDKDYLAMKNNIRKKYKDLMKMSKMTAKSGMGSSSAKQTKEKIIWVDAAKKEGFLPSQTEELDADEEQEDKEGANEGDDDNDDDDDEEEEAPKPPGKKQKGGKGAAQAPVPAVAPAKASKARGKAMESPQRSSKRRRKYM